MFLVLIKVISLYLASGPRYQNVVWFSWKRSESLIGFRPLSDFFFCLMRWYWVWLALDPFQKRFARWEHSEYLTVSGFGPLPEGLCLIGTRWGFDWLQPKVRVQRFPTRLVPNPFSGCIFTIRLLYEFLFGFGPLPVCVLYQSVLRLCKAPGFFFFFVSEAICLYLLLLWFWSEILFVCGVFKVRSWWETLFFLG